MLELYWMICGVLFNILVGGLALLALWVWIIWPAVEAVSITRMVCQARKIRGQKRTYAVKIWFHYFLDMVGGRRFESMRGDGWYWGGVGNWNIYGRS